MVLPVAALVALASTATAGASAAQGGTAAPAGLYPLLEASGAVAGAGFPAWEVVAVSANFCPDEHGNAAVVVVVSGGSMATLIGSTPHSIAHGNISVAEGVSRTLTVA